MDDLPSASISSNNNIDIGELISQLQHERQLVQSERHIIEAYNDKVSTNTARLLRLAWINFQQRVNLNALVGARTDFSPEQCCRRATSLANSVFSPAKEYFDYQTVTNYCDFLSLLRKRPDLIAQLIVIGEELTTDRKAFKNVLHSIVAGLFGSLVIPQDIRIMMNVLRYLANLQLVTTDNPRRLLRQRSCAFSQMYFMFHESLTSAKLFLIAALQSPIVKLIAMSDSYLDIDPSKIPLHFTQAERLEKFGEENTEEYKRKIMQHRECVVKTLADMANIFVASLQDNIDCFPVTLAWLIRQIAGMISKSFNSHSKEINAICTDLVFTLFICPAIIQPEPYGICDAPISEMARHNLIQVGQILQMLALLKFEKPDAKLMDLYKLFDADCIYNILDAMLNCVETEEDEIPVDNVPGVHRNIALFTELELYSLISFMKKAHNSILDQGANGHESAGLDFCSNNGDNATSPPDDPLVILMNKLPTDNDGSPRSSILQNSPTNNKNLLNKAKSHLTRSKNGDVEDNLISSTVIVVPLHEEDNKHIGLYTEAKVLSMHHNATEDLLIDITDAPLNPVELMNGNITTSQEKRTRFSHADEGSIGNTSDNLEVISEAASNHSVASSIELENEDQNDNDNLSDMVSANVSGRGTPNISGRDTPSSQVIENEDNRSLVEVRPAYLQQPQPLISKQIRSEIDDKFCKFEIKKLLEGDETISIISDTWSTDVLASDSETIDASESRQEQQNFSPILEQPSSLLQPLLDVSETQSESAWSTDVLASDTERLTEVDNDDFVSVAPSDDTASVARSDDAASVAPSERSELEDPNLNDRRLSTASASNQFEYRRLEANIRRESMPNYSTPKSENQTCEAASTSYENSATYSLTEETSVLRPVSHNCLESGKRDAIILDNKSCDLHNKRPVLGDISNNIDVPGPSGISKLAEASYLLVRNVEQQKYEDIKTDMQLSNTSLNSSSSGSSNSSEQNKNANSTVDGWKNKIWMNNTPNDSDHSMTPDSTKKSPASTRSKPSSSTGAIPKSISFDMSAEKGDKELDDDHKNKRGGFFGKLRMNFRHRRGKPMRGNDDYTTSLRYENCDDDRFKKPIDFAVGKPMSTPIIATDEEDILAKYRTKRPGNVNIMKVEKSVELDDSRLSGDESLDINTLFSDAKKKLRLVLSSSKTQNFRTKKDGKTHMKKDLEAFLQIELAKARDLKQWSISAGVAEALRCIRLLDIAGFNKLCETLRDEHTFRSVYIKYLLTSKQVLLSSQSFLEELHQHVQREKELCASFLVASCVRLFLERQERALDKFCVDFKDLKLVDEKNDILDSFLNLLFTQLRKDPLWQGASDEQIQMAHFAIERAVITQVYTQALFPNGDGDRHRDILLSKHLKKLSSTITPGHKYLMINKIYQNECPWLPAQEALQEMAAYRTPREKLRCVIKCTTAIMDLLSLAQRASTTADDLIPVLVYVIIQANPQDLLSTVQYVNTFYGNIEGEDGYWWTQFCSAVEYTKTMEYTD